MSVVIVEVYTKFMHRNIFLSTIEIIRLNNIVIGDHET